MIARRQVALAILVAGSALLYLQVAHQRPTLQTPASDNLHSPSQEQAASLISGPTANAQTSSLANTAEEPLAATATPTPARTSPVAPGPPTAVPDTPESSSLPPATVLENMRTTIRQYGSMFGGNPVGTNPEITSALQGDNPKHINFLKQDGNRVNAKGELVDPWGTPYFFHQISGQEMEIRSAGPDRVMYTGDDLIIK